MISYTLPWTPQDVTVVHTEDPREIEYWVHRLGCTPEQLRQAVAEKGPAVAGVKEYLVQLG